MIRLRTPTISDFDDKVWGVRLKILKRFANVLMWNKVASRADIASGRGRKPTPESTIVNVLGPKSCSWTCCGFTSCCVLWFIATIIFASLFGWAFHNWKAEERKGDLATCDVLSMEFTYSMNADGIPLIDLTLATADTDGVLHKYWASELMVNGKAVGMVTSDQKTSLYSSSPPFIGYHDKVLKFIFHDDSVGFETPSGLEARIIGPILDGHVDLVKGTSRVSETIVPVVWAFGSAVDCVKFVRTLYDNDTMVRRVSFLTGSDKVGAYR